MADMVPQQSGNDATIVLGEGLPLTMQELPGLHPSAADGTVALVGRKPSDPKVLLLRNRSREMWSITEPGGAHRHAVAGPRHA